MRVRTLSLRNFRVFTDLDLDLPEGVVGIYGPNGSGKSTLVEAILWALFGVARTGKDALRADSSQGECRVRVVFDHDGHVYEVTRALAGASATVTAEAVCDGLRLAAGATSVRQYVHQVLGMSADAFRASVCCEQGQLDAFSSRRPEERRRLVLDLLGITPLDRARDAARARARSASEAVEAARLVLGDLDALTAELTTLESGHATTVAARLEAEQRAQTALEAAAAADTAAAAAEETRLTRDRLRALWTEAARRRDDLARRLGGHLQELESLATAARRLEEVRPRAELLEAARARLAVLERLDRARQRLATAVEAGDADPTTPEGAGDELAATDEAVAAGVREAGEAVGRVRGREAAVDAAEARLRLATGEAEAAARLDPDAPCPLCGQELGACFEDVVAARRATLAAAQDEVDRARRELEAARTHHAAAERHAARIEARRLEIRAREQQRAAARAELDAARRAVAEAEAEAEARAGSTAEPSPAWDLARQRELVAEAEGAKDEALRLAERVARSERLEEEAATTRCALAEVEADTTRLQDEGRALRFDASAHAAALAGQRRSREAAEAAREALVEARLTERGLAERLEERRVRVADEHRRRSELACAEDEARHLGRLAELLSEFRNSLVGQVGPALSAHTTALFRELTDARFDSLDVDGDSFELRIGGAGRGHPLDRHSGSETDLANLSLRIAVGEQVNLLSGGQVGLLVLDEVLGSLDTEHRDRLLAALTRLSGRFRQVLVVTHAAEVKERLPQAIEVVPRGRTSAVRVPGSLRLADAG